jgi:hypothetical protein
VTKVVRFANNVMPSKVGWTRTGLTATTSATGIDSAHTEQVRITGTDTAAQPAYSVGNTADLTAVLGPNGSLAGAFSTGQDSAYQTDGTITAASNAFANVWTPSLATQAATDQELLTGVEYSGQPPAAMSFRALIFFDFMYDNSTC